ncbi:YigZ family protein [Aliikangiella marina]|uniref:YigZ family protein n=1 Tax=Aliikangiella marina TaxID=1712262 RepID=A0A545T4I7_9GAMM|nr:YigZ family protein [Aliikangiella marina]TQV72105.1 YigZ family protein [Aliikangiella marina]
MPSYQVPAAPIDVEEIIKNSQFITRVRNVTTVEAAKGFIKQLNSEFPDATHHCWAYIVGNPSSTTLLGCSDDGEPSGTAGKPMLNVLQHSGIGDIVAVCTRFYGGTKLGTGGLTRAYGGGVKLALESLLTEEKVEYKSLEFDIDYAQQKDCEYIIKDFQVEGVNFDFQTKISVSLQVAIEQYEELKQAIQNKFKGQIQWKVTN